MQEWLISIVTHHPYLVYGVVLIVGFFEGPVLALLCGILLRAGYFHLIPLYAVLMAGDIFGDILWYFIGRRLGMPFARRYGKHFGITEAHVTAIERVYHRYKHPILIVSKLTTGFGFATVVLFVAGMVKIPFRIYITINILGQFMWTGMLLLAGYSFGHAYAVFNTGFERASLIAGAVLIIAAIVLYGRQLGKRITAQ